MKLRKHRKYDPDPGRRRHRGHRKGVEPAGLKRWRLAHRRRRTADPGYSHSLRLGRRGGHYFSGPHKRRYDPAPRRHRFSGFRSSARGAAGKIEGGLTKWGVAIGAGISALVGVYQGYNLYQQAYGPNAGQNYLHSIIGGPMKDASGNVLGNRTPEISKLWGTQDYAWGGGTVNYLKYKFLGLDNNNQYIGSAWVIPFWAGVGAWIFSKLPLGSKIHRAQRPLGKIGKGLAGLSTFGALFLPGCGNKDPQSPRQIQALPGPGQTPMIQEYYR